MEKIKEKKERICPLCVKIYCEPPAQSRRDKKRICPYCGLEEAMEDSGMNDVQKAEIINEIRRYTGSRKGNKQ